MITNIMCELMINLISCVFINKRKSGIGTNEEIWTQKSGKQLVALVIIISGPLRSFREYKVGPVTLNGSQVRSVLSWVYFHPVWSHHQN